MYFNSLTCRGRTKTSQNSAAATAHSSLSAAGEKFDINLDRYIKISRNQSEDPWESIKGITSDLLTVWERIFEVINVVIWGDFNKILNILCGNYHLLHIQFPDL